MPSRRSRNDLVLFSSQDPQSLVNWLCDSFGLTTILQSIAQYRPTGSAEAAPTKRAYKKRAYKKRGAKKKAAGKRGRKKGSGKRAAAEAENS
jgi:hypothetical protein